jgi:hypothetical protein
VKHRSSYWKSTGLAFAICVASAACLVIASTINVSGAVGAAIDTAFSTMLIAASLVAAGGGVCLWRDRRLTAGQTDPLVAALTRVPPRGIFSKFGLRSLLGTALRPGDIVRVRSLGEIGETLTVHGTLEGLPFMPEMKTFCGHRFRVHRRVDKINDMRNKTGLRQMRGVVTLTGVRCNGADHSGCQAECQILWKDAWLVRMSSVEPEKYRPPADASAPSSDQDSTAAFTCQMTRLWEASKSMSRFDLRQDLRPLLNGNVAPSAYAGLMLTRWFNLFQALRGGVAFPYMPDRSAVCPVTQPHSEAYGNGRAVAVRSRAEIAQTLANSRTKGLWFDRDMMRYCGTISVVDKHVRRIIHEATGKMVTMKTPSIVLRDVVATGEFLRLCPQHEQIFWREAWLRPAGSEHLNRPPVDS